MRLPRILPALVMATALAAPGTPVASAAVEFTPWTPETIDDVMTQAVENDQPVMVVITQPDWCPACIVLDRSLLRNPEAVEIAALTREWQVLEVYGYDAPGAAFLESQGLSFVGTPTTLLLRPGKNDRRLGEARQMVAIAGVPEDYVDRLRAAAGGHDRIAAAQARVRSAQDTEAWLELARAYLEAGDADAARRAYRSVLLRPGLPADRQREISLEAIVQPTQRVEKDHSRALKELDAWAGAHPDATADGEFVYARVWSLLALDRISEARQLIQTHYLSADTADALATYLYLAFRHPSEVLLEDAEARARAGVERYPEQRGRLLAAHGRILRRQGRLEAAEAAFAAAVEATDPASDSYQTYLGQLEFVRRELAGGQG